MIDSRVQNYKTCFLNTNGVSEIIKLSRGSTHRDRRLLELHV